MNYKIKLASINQVDDIINMYTERVKWFKNKSIDQWSNYMKNHPKEEFLYYIKNKTYYVVLDKDIVIGGFELSNNNKYWIDSDNSAYYINKIVTKIGYRKIGKIVFDFCKNKAIKDNKKFLRIDCVRYNKKLNDIYENYGFKLIKHGKNKRYSYALREMKV